MDRHCVVCGCLCCFLYYTPCPCLSADCIALANTLLKMKSTVASGLPLSNSPVTDVTSQDVVCKFCLHLFKYSPSAWMSPSVRNAPNIKQIRLGNVNSGPVGEKCAVPAGSTVTVEMHQQPGDRSCNQESIGDNHFGPVMVYMSVVDDSNTADGSAGWFKVYEDTWAPAPDSSSGSDDYWGTKDMNDHCGRMDVPIPADLASGDYLLRSEVIALHAASSSG